MWLEGSEPCLNPTPSHSTDELTEAPRGSPLSKLNQGQSQNQKPGLWTLSSVLLPKSHMPLP